jgi:hypothetical protein
LAARIIRPLLAFPLIMFPTIRVDCAHKFSGNGSNAGTFNSSARENTPERCVSCQRHWNHDMKGPKV